LFFSSDLQLYFQINGTLPGYDVQLTEKEQKRSSVLSIKRILPNRGGLRGRSVWGDRPLKTY